MLKSEVFFPLQKLSKLTIVLFVCSALNNTVNEVTSYPLFILVHLHRQSLLSILIFEARKFVSHFGKQIGCYKSFFSLSAFPRDDCPGCVTSCFDSEWQRKIPCPKDALISSVALNMGGPATP